MANYMTLLWQRFSTKDTKNNGEIERIGALQQTAAARRAEYAEMKAQDIPAGPLSASRKRMEETDSAHAAALQAWENRQSRQKSR